MKRVAILICILLLILTGCTKPLDDPSKGIEEMDEQQQVIDEVEDESIKQFNANRATFHFVVDWLNDSEIVFVEKNGNVYVVKSFNIHTGEIRTIYEDTMIIANVLIHPTEDYLLIHTTENPYAATIKIVSMDGVVQNEVSVESSEIHIEWNDLNPFYFLVTAFHQDWSYDVFMFDGEQNNLQLVSIENPFPKWLGVENVIFTSQENHPLDGDKLFMYHVLTGEISDYGEEHVIFYDSFKDFLLYMKVNEKEQSEYTIENMEKTELAHWSMPTVSNYSEWVIPDIQWIASDLLFLSRAKESSQLDELDEPFELIKVEGNEQTIIDAEPSSFMIKCTSDAKWCMSGETLDRVMELASGKEEQWLRFLDE